MIVNYKDMIVVRGVFIYIDLVLRRQSVVCVQKGMKRIRIVNTAKVY